MSSRAQKAALLVILALVVGLAATAVALEMRPDPAPPVAPAEDHDGAMTSDEQCAHMPEHCPQGGASGG